jgi:hypothetical protein
MNYVYAVPLQLPEKSPLRIDEFGPKDADAGKPFNVQPDGAAAMWVIAPDLSPTTVAVVDGVQMNSAVTPDGLTFVVPADVYGTPGDHTLMLRDNLDHRVSNSVSFRVH